MTIIFLVINWILFFGYWLSIASVTLKVIMKRRTVSSVIAWLLIIYNLPLIGIITYLLFGELNLDKCRFKRSQIFWSSTTQWIKDIKNYCDIFTSTKNSDVAHSLFQLCKNRQGIGGLGGNQIQLLTSTDDTLITLIHDINLAKKNIEMVFYIWQVGGLVNQVTEALIAASKRGVCCRLILDSAGSTAFFRSLYPTLMRNAGINVVEALHVNIFLAFLRRMDLRQHRKMILIDNYIAYTGSMNMVDPRFFKQDAGVGQWIDIMTRVKGPVATIMSIIFSCDWAIETGESILPSLIDINIIPFNQEFKNNMQVIASGPGFSEGIIHQALLTSIYAARKQLVITTPYLVPSDELIHAICTAAQRGVKVYIIVPRHNDSILVRWASRAFFTEFLEAGVFIYQFESGLLHTKSMLVDGQLSLVGTANLDMRSLWLNFEMTLIIDDYHFSKNLSQLQENYLTRSKLIENKVWSKRPYWQRIIEQLFYFFSPLL